MEPSDDEGFEARLNSAIRKNGGDPDKVKRDEASSTAWGLGGRVGVELLSAFIAGTGLGWVLDHWLHTRPFFLILGVVLGGVSGVWNVWRLMR